MRLEATGYLGCSQLLLAAVACIDRAALLCIGRAGAAAVLLSALYSALFSAGYQFFRVRHRDLLESRCESSYPFVMHACWLSGDFKERRSWVTSGGCGAGLAGLAGLVGRLKLVSVLGIACRMVRKEACR